MTNTKIKIVKTWLFKIMHIFCTHSGMVTIYPKQIIFKVFFPWHGHNLGQTKSFSRLLGPNIILEPNFIICPVELFLKKLIRLVRNLILLTRLQGVNNIKRII